MKSQSLLIIGLAFLVSSCGQTKEEQQSTPPKKEDQNFEQRRKDMEQPNKKCCEATQDKEKASVSNETAGASEAKVETKQ